MSQRTRTNLHKGLLWYQIRLVKLETFGLRAQVMYNTLAKAWKSVDVAGSEPYT